MAIKRVFIAGPYTRGDAAQNVRNAIVVADQLLSAGLAPYTPHLTHFQHLVYPRKYEDWTALDLEWLRVSDAVIRLPGDSPGADHEVAEAKRLGIPVYYGVAAFFAATGIGRG